MDLYQSGSVLSYLMLPLAVASSFFSVAPQGFDNTTWASYSFEKLAVLPGSFNRTVFDAVVDANVSDPGLAAHNKLLNSTTFVAYDDRFYDILGPRAVLSKVVNLTFQNHEAACFDPATKNLFFTEWGPPGLENNHDRVHSWQYMLNTKNNVLRKVTTDPPIINFHGCVAYKDDLYVVNDGSDQATGALHRVNPRTLESTTLLNNYYQQPFNGFNDIDVDPEGNFWVTDSSSGSDRELIPFAMPTNPTVYMINGTTMRPHVIHISPGNVNGIAYSRAPTGGEDRLYVSDSGAFRPRPLDPYGLRSLTSFDIPRGSLPAKNERLFSSPISNFYDGVRVSHSGWVFAAAGDGVEILDPRTGMSLGSIRVGGDGGKAVNMAFGDHEMWIVGYGGVWHLTHTKERLGRGW